MFERFTERARTSVRLAQEAARDFKHDYIGTEHVLVSLCADEDVLASRVLSELGLTVEIVRGDIEHIVGSGEEEISGQIPFTSRTKKVYELALREALSHGHNYIGTEHILLGLVRENEGVAARILLDHDADSEKVRGAVLRELTSGLRQSVSQRSVPFQIDPALLRDVFAALAFLWHDELPETVYESLSDPSDATLAALSKLVGIRRGSA